MVEADSKSNPEDLTRRLQLRLCDALDKVHGANEGVIGREARAALKRWPVSIYWQGLAEWSIRRYHGASPSSSVVRRRHSLRRAAGATNQEGIDDGGYETSDGLRPNWSTVPIAPAGFPDVATFNLTAEEGRFLIESLALKHGGSYLAHILRLGVTEAETTDFPWDYSLAQTAPRAVQSWLNDARLFSIVHRGGALLYNLMLAEAFDDEQNVVMFSDRLADWSQSMAELGIEFERWDRAAMWERLHSKYPRLRRPTREFVERWNTLATNQSLSSLVNGREPRALIRNRERSLKGIRSRLTYADARAARRGYPTSARLEFRWAQAQRITTDILASLRADDA